MDNVKKTQEFFDSNFRKLERTKEKKQLDIIKATEASLKNKLSGKVLDIGSGGKMHYSTHGINELICADMSFQSLEKAREDNKVECIITDARNLALCDNSFDCVVILHTLHHLAGNSAVDTRKNVLRCLKESHRVLKEEGKILIIDAFCKKIMERVEDLFHNTFFFIFENFGKPMVHYFSLIHITEALRQSGFKNITFSYLDTGNAKLCPFASSRGIPFKYTPVFHVLIEAVA